jgi:hypothetical protein
MPGDLLGLTGAHLATDIGHSLRAGFYMFWTTLWALVLGFGLSGAVQAFVSRQKMRQRLGDHGVTSVVRASAYGMVSSSCSYAASAMAKSVFVRGADFVASMVFMFASTNLVLELGAVLVVLIGWQFVAAEFAGGVIMIALLVVAGGLWFRGRALASARRIAGADEPEEMDDARQRFEGIRTAGGWAAAAGYTMSDLRMLRRELLVGFVAAGFLAGLVPNRVWGDLFFHGHGFWTSLENVVVGPIVAIFSFVCSIGNVPLAAALWQGGISFGGVVSFIFADLITLPLLLIYRKQYGGRMTLRMLAVFWAVMSLSGLVCEYAFKAIGLVPSSRRVHVAADSLRWDYTTILDILALIAFGGLWWLYRNRDRLSWGARYATDPVCGMQVEKTQAPASAEVVGQRSYFCSEHCRDRFVSAEPVTPLPVGQPLRR